MFQEDIQWITGTPIGINIRTIEFIPPHCHTDIIEIIFCIKGGVKFFYAFEDFEVSEGELISVDKDMHYLSSNNDNVCVSFYLDLKWFKERYPYINSLFFVCEALKVTQTEYTKNYHSELKGILISTLLYIYNNKKNDNNYKEIIIHTAEKIINLFIYHFDIIFYYRPQLNLNSELFDRYHCIMMYLNEHSNNKVLLKELANKYNLSTSYLSEFFRNVSIGFRQFIGYIRAVESEKLIVDNKMSIISISEWCGFSDPKYYYRAFYKWHKCTPSQFKKNYGDKINKECIIKEINIETILLFLDKIMHEHYMELFLNIKKE